MTAQEEPPMRPAQESARDIHEGEASSSDSCFTAQASSTKPNRLSPPSTVCNESQSLSDDQLGAVNLASLRAYYCSPRNAVPHLPDGGHAPRVNNKRTLPFDQGTEVPAQRRRILHTSNDDEHESGRVHRVHYRGHAGISPDLTLPPLQMERVPARPSTGDGTEAQTDLHGTKRVPAALRAFLPTASQDYGHDHILSLLSAPARTESSNADGTPEELHSQRNAAPVHVHAVPGIEGGFARLPEGNPPTPKAHLGGETDELPVRLSNTIDESRKQIAEDAGHGTESTRVKTEVQPGVIKTEDAPHYVKEESSEDGPLLRDVERRRTVSNFIAYSERRLSEAGQTPHLAFLKNDPSAWSVRYGARATFRPRMESPHKPKTEEELLHEKHIVDGMLDTLSTADDVRKVRYWSLFLEAVAATPAEAAATTMDVKAHKEYLRCVLGRLAQERFVRKHMHLLIRDNVAGSRQSATHSTRT